MEINELKNIWVEIQGILTPITKDELREILIKKTTHIINKFLKLLVISISICICVVVFLMIISINRKNDILFLIHNGILIVFIILSAYYYLKCYWNMNLKKTEKFTVYESLNDQIQMISESGNLEKIPGFIIGILLFVSIYVYFSAKSYIEALKDEENLWGLLFGLIIGIIVTLYIVWKMNKYQKREISKLKYYRDQLLSF